MRTSSMIFFFLIFTFMVLTYATFPRHDDKINNRNDACIKFAGDPDFSCSSIELPAISDTNDLSESLEKNREDSSDIFKDINSSIDVGFNSAPLPDLDLCKPLDTCSFGEMNND